MAFTTPATSTAGSVLTAAYLNTFVRDNVAWMATDSPAVRAYNNANISVNSAVWTSLTFNSERFDNAAFHSTSANTSRLTVPTGGGGKYLVGGCHEWAVTASGAARSARIYLNGTTPVAWQATSPSATHGAEIAICSVYAMSAADYFEWQAYQDTGGALNNTTNANAAPEFFAFWFRT